MSDDLYQAWVRDHQDSVKNEFELAICQRVVFPSVYNKLIVGLPMRPLEYSFEQSRRHLYFFLAIKQEELGLVSVMVLIVPAVF